MPVRPGRALASIVEVAAMNNRYRYRVTLYCNQSKAVRRAAANIVMYCNTEKSFRDVTVFADDNPLD